MDQFMAFASGISFVKEEYRSEDAYYREHDKGEARRVRSLPLASAALLVVMFVVSGVFLA